jgi:hypothetical protein
MLEKRQEGRTRLRLRALELLACELRGNMQRVNSAQIPEGRAAISGVLAPALAARGLGAAARSAQQLRLPG